MKRIVYFVIASFLFITLVSCKQDVEIHNTPTIRGSIAIPVNSGFKGNDFYIRVSDGDSAVYTGKAKDDGSFAIEGLTSAVKYDVLITTAEPGDVKASREISATVGYGGWLYDIYASTEEKSSVGQVKVKPLGTIKGVVKKNDSLDGYDTMVYIPGTSFVSMTDAKGNFKITNVPQSVNSYSIRAVSNGYLARMIEGIILFSDSEAESPERILEEITLIKNYGSVEGFVIRDGEADNSGIVLRLEQENAPTNYTATTGENGFFRIDNVLPGRYRVLASYAGYLTQASDFYDVVPAGVTSIADRIELAQSIGTIKGSVRLAGNQASGGVTVSITGIDSERNYTAVTTDDGSFIRNVSAGQYKITAYYPSYSSRSMEVSVSQKTSTVVDLGELSLSSGIVTGSVVLEGILDNYSGVIVTVSRANNPSEKYSSFTDAQGKYSITGISNAGDFVVECTKDGFVKNPSVLVSVSLGIVNEVPQITLKNLTSKVIGKVSLEGTEDFTGTSVMLKGSGIQYDATTDQNGEYIISGVNPGIYSLIVSRPGYISKTNKFIIIESATTKNLEKVSLKIGTRSIAGRATLELRSDYSGALITATNLEDSKLVYSAISNSNGNFTLAGMKPGEYMITLSCAGYNTITLPSVNIIDGSEMVLDSCMISIARGTISGSAILEGRASNAGVRVELLKGAEVYATTTTDESGLYAFSVPQGNYSGVRLSSENFRSVSISQSIALIANDCVTIGEEGGSTLMIATHVPVLKGRLTVAGVLSMDYSGITVTLVENGMTTQTDTDGYWSFSKVPVGSYTLLFERENITGVTKLIDVVAAAEKRIETIQLIPNAASIEGHVTLNSVSDYSGITVRATADGMAELSTKTNAAGYFYLGNVVTTETYTVIFEKDGWVSQTREVCGLENLSLNDITLSNPVALSDTTAPVIDTINIAVGNSEINGRQLNLYFNINEDGSGPGKVYVNTSNNFSGVSPFDYDNPLSCYVADVEGNHTLYIKIVDQAGNVSAVTEQPFRISDFKTVVSSVLLDNEDGRNDGIITWTKAKSPYYVTGNILVDEGTTLIVEPGVNIQLSGPFYFQVEGSIKINGTSNEKVYIYGVGEGTNTWYGINGEKTNSNTICNAVLTGMKNGISGYVIVQDSEITSIEDGYAFNDFLGVVENCTINGKINSWQASFIKNRIKSYLTFPVGISNSYLTGNSIIGDVYIGSSFLENNLFGDGYARIEWSGMEHNSFINSILRFENYNGQGVFSNCHFENCTFESFGAYIVKQSNFIDCGPIVVDAGRNDSPSLDMRGNYWGRTNTIELNSYGLLYNHSFVYDYYDDFSLSKVNLSGYASDVYEGVGYLGDDYYPKTKQATKNYSLGDEGPAGGIVFYDKGYYSEGWRYLEVSPKDLGEYCFGILLKEDVEYEYYYDYGVSIGTGLQVGTGRINTKRIVEAMGQYASYLIGTTFMNTEYYAAKVCDDFAFNGYSDWFLPSRDEARLIYTNLVVAGLGNLKGSDYLSSSEWGGFSRQDVCPTNGNDNSWLSKSAYYSIRPIRAF